MKHLLHSAIAGFDEKNDVLITAEPIPSGIEIELSSHVIHQYGRHIKTQIQQTVTEAGFDGVKIIAQDKGAWDYTIKARVLAALARGSENDEH